VHLAPTRRYRIGLHLSALSIAAALAIGAPPAAGAAPTCAEGPQTVGREIVGTPCADTIRAPRNITTVRGEGGDDVLFGQRGNDSLFGGEGADRLYGGVGDDRLRGGPGADRLSGGFGADSLDGETGDDLDRGDATVDSFGDSGGGTDTLSFATGVTPGFPNQNAFFDDAGFPPDVGRGVYVDLGGGFANDGLAPSGGGVDQPLQPETSFGNFEVVIGTPFDDYIVGTSDPETFYGGGGADLIDGKGGADVAYGGAEGDGCIVPTAHECESSEAEIDPRGPGTFSAGVMATQSSAGPALFFSGTDGDDDVVASYASNQVSFTVGGSPAGSFAVSEAPDSLLLAGLDGADTLSATGFPEATSVVLLGGEDDDDLNSGATEDADIDGAGDDVVSAGAGDDAVPNNGGADDLDAGAGEDLFIDNAVCDGDQLDGGPDRDNANWANFGSAIAIDMATQRAGLVGGSGEPRCPSGTLTSLTAIEDVEGTGLADTMVGDADDNQLLGRQGADTFDAAAGNDSILANSGTPADDPDAAIDCGPGFDTAQIDRPANGPDPAPTECEVVEERDPNSFRPPDTPPDTPETAIDAAPPALTKSTSAEFTFSASPAAGASFECKLDAAAFAACSSPKTYSGLSGNGAVTGTAHTFQVRAKNTGGTDATPALYNWTVDTVKPTAEITGPPPDPSDGESVAFAFEADEPATFSCSLEGPKPSGAAACASGVAYSSLPDGNYTFRVAATDQAGNVGDPAAYTWEVDNSIDEPPPPVPDTAIGSKPPALTNSTTAQFGFTATPPTGAAFECRLDGVAFSACTAPVSYSELEGDGAATGTAHTFEVRAKNAGGIDPTPTSYTWTVDTVRPEVSLTDRPADPSAASDAAFSFTADEPATFACSLAGPRSFAAAPCSSGISYPALPAGRYTFEVTATDPAGNAGDPVSYEWQVESRSEPPLPPPPPPPPPAVDRTRPQTRIAAGVPKRIRASHKGRRRVSFRFSSNERGARFICQLDRRRAVPCASPRAYTVGIGRHTFRVTAIDAAGNRDRSPALFRLRVLRPRGPRA
jgi:Ca2+-binding RTX toxin-like protein